MELLAVFPPLHSSSLTFPQSAAAEMFSCSVSVRLISDSSLELSSAAPDNLGKHDLGTVLMTSELEI